MTLAPTTAFFSFHPPRIRLRTQLVPPFQCSIMDLVWILSDCKISGELDRAASLPRISKNAPNENSSANSESASWPLTRSQIASHTSQSRTPASSLSPLIFDDSNPAALVL